MKINKKKTLIGAISTLALATASFAVVGFNDVEASAEQTEYATNSAKWQTVTGMTVNSTYGLVPNVLSTNADVMVATSVNLSADSNGKITSTIKGGTYGVMAYYLKWNEGTDSVTWAWGSNSSELGANEFGTKNLPTGSSIYPEKITASNVKGDWIAIILSYDIAPFVLECNNGTITKVCDLWVEGFGPSDYNNFFAQTTQVSYSVEDTASGANYGFSYYTADYGIKTEVGMNIGSTYTSANANLKGEGAVRIEKIIAGAEFTSGNGDGTPDTYFSVAIEEGASGDVGGGDAGGGTTTTENWQELTNITEDETTGVLTPTVASGTQFSAISKNVEGVMATAEITTDFKDTASPWGVLVYYLEWNKGVDSVTWQMGDGNATFPIGSDAGLNASSVAGDWVALVVNTADKPFVLECANGVITNKGLLSTALDGYDYWYLFNQKTTVGLMTTDTASGVDISISFDAINAGQDKVTYSYSSTNTNLKGTGAFGFVRVTGNAVLSSANASITAKVESVVTQPLDAPQIAQDGTRIKWTAIPNAEKYAYTVDGGSVQYTTNCFVECSTDGQKVKVKAVGDGVYYSESDWSNEVTYDAPAVKMATPVVSVDIEGKASWTEIEGATSYSYKINDGEAETTTELFVILSDGDTITVQAVSSNTEEYLASDWSTVVNYKAPKKMATPSVSVNESGLASWTEIEGATYYLYKINDGQAQQTNGLSVPLADGDTITVQAVTEDIQNYKNSDWSDTVVYNAPMTKLATPQVALVGNEASWTADLNATKYVYKIGEDGAEMDAQGNSVELTDGDTIYVKAIGDNDDFEDSDWSTAVTYTADTLATPQVTLEENVASWATVEGAVSYTYKFGENGEEITINETSITLVHGQTLFVKANGNDKTSLDSDWSTAVSYTATALQTPVVELNGDVASWNVVAGANGYKYKIDGGEEQTTTELCVILTDGQSVQVKALGNNETSLDSDWSTAVSYTAPEVPDEPDEPEVPDVPVTPDDGETFTVEEVTEMIGALSTEVTNRQAYTRIRAMYLEAKEAYYTLSAEDMALVENAEVLTSVQATLNAFKAKVDKADEVDAMVTAIPTTTITAENYEIRKAQITAANEAYNALSAEEKALCQKARYLENRNAQLAEYEASPEEKGCGSSIGGFALAGVALAGLAVLKRKKRED